MAKKPEQGNGMVEVDVDKNGFHLIFTNAPRWAYILISIGLMFGIIILAHATYRYFEKRSEVKAIAEKLANDVPLDDKEVARMEEMPEEEQKELRKEVMTIEADGLRVEQRPAPGTKVTIEKDGEKTTITKGRQ